jgi:hypothetical protein
VRTCNPRPDNRKIKNLLVNLSFLRLLVISAMVVKNLNSFMLMLTPSVLVICSVIFRQVISKIPELLIPNFWRLRTYEKFMGGPWIHW